MGMKYNLTAAFVDFCNGLSLEDIAQTRLIPLDHLQGVASKSDWTTLRGAMVPAVAVQDVATKPVRDWGRITANREKNLTIAQLLQQDLLTVAQQLVAGTLQLERVTSKGSVVKYTPGLAERAQLGQYARAVAEISSKALGDEAEGREGGEKPEGSRGLGQGAITIVLPPIVARPRQERVLEIDVDHEVITSERLSKPLGLERQVVDCEDVATAAEPESDTRI